MESLANSPRITQTFWNTFQATLSHDASAFFYEAFHFDDNEPSANSLCALVLSGQKRATAGLLWAHEHENKPLPTVGALSVVTDWPGTPRCVIESTEVKVVPFDRVTERFAAIEGEADGSLKYWREVHWECFSRECARIGREPVMEMPVVCETFRVVYPSRDSD